MLASWRIERMFAQAGDSDGAGLRAALPSLRPLRSRRGAPWSGPLRPSSPRAPRSCVSSKAVRDQVAAILKADDVSATIEWYSQIGFQVRGRFPEEEPNWCELARDGLVLQFL